MKEKNKNSLPFVWNSIYNDVPKIIGIDPGDSSGFVVFDIEKEKIHDYFTLNQETLIGVFENLAHDNFRSAEETFKICKINKVIIEEFKIYPWANLNFQELSVVKIIGVLEYLIPKEYIVFQKPADKNFFKEPKIRKFGYDIKGWNSHEKDALKHILFYYHLVKHNTKIFLKYLRENNS